MYKLLIFILFLLTILYNYYNKRLASSSSMWVFCYVLIFVIYPLYNKDIIFSNEKTIDIFALLGIIMFFIGLTFGSRIVIKTNRNFKKNLKEVSNFYVACCCFFIFLVISLIILIRKIQISGIISILNGSFTSKKFALEHDNSSSAFVFSVHLLVPCLLSIWMSSNTKKEKKISIFCLILYLIVNLFFVFTRIFMISVIAIILIHEIRNKNNFKQLIFLSSGVIILVVFMILLNFIRTFGLGTEISASNLLDFSYVFESTDFGASYYWFDELLNYKSPFINPIVYFKPFFAFIPRFIWQNKPEPLSLQILKYINPTLAARGYSTAGNSILGEGYSVASYFGMLLYPFLWGMICGKFDKSYYRRLKYKGKTSLKDIYYYIFEVFIIISCQRGDWSQYMTVVIWFYIVPLYLMSKVSSKLCNNSN